jgi:uncharacterized protein YjiS (DUF1127 family)
MTSKSNAAFRVAAGHGLVPRPTWLERILTMFDVRRSRLDLADLTDAQLLDIGLTRDDVEREVSRPIWDVPPHWRR